MTIEMSAEARMAVMRVFLEDAKFREKDRSAGGERMARFRQHMDVCIEEWEWLRATVFNRDGYRCTYCEADVRDFPQCDHVVPRSRGGLSIVENLTTACKACNSGKRDRLPEEWRRHA